MRRNGAWRPQDRRLIVPCVALSLALHAGLLGLWPRTAQRLAEPPDLTAVELVAAEPVAEPMPTPLPEPAPMPAQALPPSALPPTALPPTAPTPPTPAPPAPPPLAPPPAPSPLPAIPFVAPIPSPSRPPPPRPAPPRVVPYPPSRPPVTEAAAPAASQGTPAPDPEAAWRAALAAWVEQHKTYPPSARLRGIEGTVTVRFTVAPGGAVSEVAIAATSGALALDEAVRRMLEGAQVPAFPPGMAATPRSETLRIGFKLQ